VAAIARSECGKTGFRETRAEHLVGPESIVVGVRRSDGARARSRRCKGATSCRAARPRAILSPQATEASRLFNGSSASQPTPGDWLKIKRGGAILKNRSDLFWATLGEGGIVLALSAIGWATHQPLIFASLGPTAYELVEQPQLPSARAYNIIAGHLIGLGAGFLALYLLNAWSAPNVLATGIVPAARVWATAISTAVTTLISLVLKAGQPAALATTLLVSLGAMQTGRDAAAIIWGVLLITAIGEPVRRFRQRHTRIRPVLTDM
jgi:hypothetical protein